MILRTPRLLLDSLTMDDAPMVLAYRGDPDISRYQGWKPQTIAEVEAFIADQHARAFAQPDGWNQLAIRDAASGELLGDFGIHFPASGEDAIEFGLSLQHGAQGRGYALEAMRAVMGVAFTEWGYRRLVASVDPRNTASVALCRSLGLRQEAHHVESYFFRGEWVDDMVFALLAREWATP
ncbi:RimJ/RimL family protein N-acetyltransferase [Luteibacter sp. Sphag1AF]|uniref:GNAT family N-acetyltransferase n=1 Tax=Luteibacter sp. Sphag1AF TaxID=2587031 RepID=UPI0016142D91|nr:GNAT family N-acetyltransferase [Luteibacter sp. Sphag1AF]MBB3228276.1 RimJ/RimL family protein N-acetyltransferase [Luteibacter sp. Sphag1AF]